MTPQFRVEVEQVQEVGAVKVVGELDQATAPELDRGLTRAIEAGSGPLLLDLTDCAFIDSTGLGVIVATRELLATRDGRRLVICCPGEQVRKLLEITGVDRAMSLHETRDEALAAARDGRD